MVRLIFVAFLLLSTGCRAQLFETKIDSDHIRIDQVGPRDYMLEAVILTIEKVELKFPERPQKVNRNVFDSLSRYIDKLYKEKPSILLRKIDVNEFGIFKVTVRVKGKTEIFFTRNRKNAVSFLSGFTKLMKDVSAPEESIKKAEHMLEKINY